MLLLLSSSSSMCGPKVSPKPSGLILFKSIFTTPIFQARVDAQTVILKISTKSYLSCVSNKIKTSLFTYKQSTELRQLLRVFTVVVFVLGKPGCGLHLGAQLQNWDSGWTMSILIGVRVEAGQISKDMRRGVSNPISF